MTNTKNDGGPAFPLIGPDFCYPGMTLRQWYAGMALQGIMANPGVDAFAVGEGMLVIVDQAIEIADAIIAADGVSDDE